jgi:hypothetical protein
VKGIDLKYDFTDTAVIVGSHIYTLHCVQHAIQGLASWKGMRIDIVLD